MKSKAFVLFALLALGSGALAQEDYYEEDEQFQESQPAFNEQELDPRWEQPDPTSNSTSFDFETSGDAV